jgi:spore coat protein JB
VIKLESRQDLLDKIHEVSFAMYDLNLFLDTHPTDPNALDLFQEYHDERKKLLLQFAAEYEPLTLDCVELSDSGQADADSKYLGQRHYNWVDGPLPWEGGLV